MTIAGTRTEEIIDAFDRKAQRWTRYYDCGGSMRPRIARFLDTLQRVFDSPGKVLDVGCGTGEIARALAEKEWGVTACDISPGMLERARSSPGSDSVEWLALRPEECLALPFEDETFDAVIASSVLEYVEDLERQLCELARVVRQEGWLLATVPDLRHPTRRREALMMPFGRSDRLCRLLQGSRLDLTYLRLSRNRFPVGRWQVLLTQPGFEVVEPGPCVDPLLLFCARKVSGGGQHPDARPAPRKRGVDVLKRQSPLRLVPQHDSGTELLIDLRLAGASSRVGRESGEHEYINREQVVSHGLRWLVRTGRLRRYDQVSVHVDSFSHLGLTRLRLIVLLMRTRRRFLLDSAGCTDHPTWPSFLVADGTKLICEALLLPMALALGYVSGAALSLSAPRLRRRRNATTGRPHVVYLRTDVGAAISAGGMAAHVAGVLGGVRQLGLATTIVSTDGLPRIADPNAAVDIVEPGGLFEVFPEVARLVNGWRFVLVARSRLRHVQNALLYQRHSLLDASGVVLAALRRTRIVLEYNGSFTWVNRNWGGRTVLSELTDLWERAALRAADLVVVVSEALADAAVPVCGGRERIFVNPNGVDVALYDSARYEAAAQDVRCRLGIAPGEVLVGFVGTFGPWHGAEVLAAAIKHVLAQAPSVRFVFIGDGARLPEVRHIVERDGVGDAVVFTGLLPQMGTPVYMAACDVLASPHVPNPDGTRFFGSPTKLFEYMAMSRGIVASALEQISEILSHDVDALLVPPGDPKALADALVALARDPEKRRRLGENARRKVAESFTWRANVERVLTALGVS